MSRSAGSIRGLAALASARNATDTGGLAGRVSQLQAAGAAVCPSLVSKSTPATGPVATAAQAFASPLSHSPGATLAAPSWQLLNQSLPGPAACAPDAHTLDLLPSPLAHLAPGFMDAPCNTYASEGPTYKPTSQGQGEHKKDTRKHGPSGGPSTEGDEVTEGVGAGQMPRQDVPPVMPGSPGGTPPSPDVTQPGENVIKPEYTTPGTDRGPHKSKDPLKAEAHQASYLRQVTEHEVLKRADHTAARRADNAQEDGSTTSAHFDDVDIEGVVDNPQKRKVWAATAPIESLLELRNPLKPQQKRGYASFATFATKAGSAGGRTPKQGPGVQDEGPGTTNDPNTNPPTLEQQQGTPNDSSSKDAGGNKGEKRTVEDAATPRTDADLAAKANDIASKANEGNDYNSDTRGRAPSKQGDGRLEKDAEAGEVYANPTGQPVDIAPEQSGG